MWSLNNFANKAAEALNTAKKGIADITKEPSAPPNKKPEISMNMLKKQCLKFKADIDRQNEEILTYKQIISDLQKDQPSHRSENQLINFKIVIGKHISEEDSINQYTEKIEELTETIDQKQREIEKIKEISSENNESYFENLESQSNTISELQKKCKTIEDENKGLQESLNKHKTRIQKNILDSYEILKNSFSSIGLMIPQIKPENLGLEDIQEFIYTQSRYIDDSINAVNALTIQFNKKSSNLEDLKMTLQEILTESLVKVKESTENSKNFEALAQKTMKEKEDVHRILIKKDERLKQLSEDVKKMTEDCRAAEELRIENSKLLQKVKNLTESKENTDKTTEDLKTKLKKVSDNLISIEETNTNLNTRLKFVNLTINDKDSQIKSLQDQLFHQNSQFLDSQSCLEEYKQTSERNLKEVNDMYTRKISEIEESYKVLILDLKTQLSKIQNEAKDANILKIQATKYQQ